ncbi:MAG: polyprenol phosphomannose-dependent alpha 1,6 mannosyltransferase MptB [Acidimicrobiales bacterium]
MPDAPGRGRSSVQNVGFDSSPAPRTSRTPPTFLTSLTSRTSRALDRLNGWDTSLRAQRPFGTIVRWAQGPVTSNVESGRFFVGPAILGTLATTLIILGGCQPSSPFVQKQPDAWFFGVSGATGSTFQVFFGLACVYGGLVLFVRVWLGLMRAISQSDGVPIKKLAWLLVLWSLPVIIGPPIFSHDIYSYAAQGEMMSRHINPYQYGPYTLGQTPLTWLVDPLWYNTPSPYGPLFEEIAGVFTNVAHHNILAELVLLRLLAFGGVVLFAACLPALARSYGRNAAMAFAFAVLNPVTILHLIGGGHNDALMVGLLVAGLLLARRRHPVLGIVLCALAASVKAPAAVAIVYIGWDWVGQKVPFRERIRPVATAVLLGSAVMGALSVVTGLGWGWVSDLASPDSVRSWMAPATAIGLGLYQIVHFVGIGLSESSAITAVQLIGLLAAAVISLRLLLRSDRLGPNGAGPLRALGLTMLWIVVLGPVVQPWYFSWAIVLLAPVVTGWLRRVLIVLSTALVFICFSGGTQLTHDLRSSYLDVAIDLLICLVFFLVPLGRVKRKALSAPVSGVRPAVGVGAPKMSAPAVPQHTP